MINKKFFNYKKILIHIVITSLVLLIIILHSAIGPMVKTADFVHPDFQVSQSTLDIGSAQMKMTSKRHQGLRGVNSPVGIACSELYRDNFLWRYSIVVCFDIENHDIATATIIEQSLLFSIPILATQRSYTTINQSNNSSEAGGKLWREDDGNALSEDQGLTMPCMLGLNSDEAAAIRVFNNYNLPDQLLRKIPLSPVFGFYLLIIASNIVYLLLTLIIALLHAFGRRIRVGQGRCVSCGYDLSNDIGSGICPECGTSRPDGLPSSRPASATHA